MSECLWNSVGQDWNVFDQVWNDIVPCVAQIAGDIILGAPPEDAYAKAVKDDKKLHRKLIKIIMILKGETFEQEKEIDTRDYKVTASDIKLLMEEYHKRKESLSITVDDITIR